jgi:hypothetical protein
MPNKTNDAPILLLQWLGTTEYKETKTALVAFRNEVNIKHSDVRTKAGAMRAIKRWLKGNPNAQFLFIGTHGDKDGIGRSMQNGVEWPELWAVLKKAVGPPIAVWLGACHSAFAAKAWSPVKGAAPIDYIVGFPVAINAKEIEKVLHQLLKMTGMNPITFVDQEIPKLRRAVAKTTVLMHYKALTKAGQLEYIDFDDFSKVVGMPLNKYLKLQSQPARRRHAGGGQR